MILQERIEVMGRLGEYLRDDNEEWQAVKEKAYTKNGWFLPAFIQHAALNIANQFLDREKLITWAAHYHIDENITQKNIGIIMAGNIPMVGFHDLLSVFISGHKQTIKLSSKDDELIPHLVSVLNRFNPEVASVISFADMLKGYDAYIATGSNNSAKLFEEYFSKYPSIIRRNRTSVAVLTGNETPAELQLLSDDVHLFFGLGCRNVTKVYVPEGYDFVPLLNSFSKYLFFADHHKYKNNYDYQLSLVLLNNIFYMTNEATLMIKNESLFSPISQLNYEFYKDIKEVYRSLKNNDDVQCIAGSDEVPFGQTQMPGLFNYADGVDIMQFLLTL